MAFVAPVPAGRPVLQPQSKGPGTKGPVLARVAAAAPPQGPGGLPAFDPNNPAYQINASPTPQVLYNTAAGLANLQTSATVDPLRAQIAQNNQQTQGALNLTGGFLNQLGQQQQQTVNTVNANQGKLNGTLAGIAGDTQNAIGQAGKGATDALNRYTFGDTNQGAMGNLAQEIARQQGMAAQNAGAYRSFGAVQGASDTSLAAELRGASAMRGQEALRSIASAGQLKNAGASQKISSALANRGALFTDKLGQLKQQAVANQVANKLYGIKSQQSQNQASVAQAKLGLDYARFKNTMSQQQFQNMLADQKFGLDVQKYGSTQAVKNWQQAHGTGPFRLPTAKGAKPLSLSQNNAIINGISTAQSAVQNIKQNYPGLSPQIISQLLTTGKVTIGVPKTDANGNPIKNAQGQPLMMSKTITAPRVTGGSAGAIATAATDLEHQGYLGQAAIDALHNLGFTIGNRYQIYPGYKSGATASPKT